jgi:hypothetical protein
MGFRDLKVGDPVFRLLDPIKVEMLVVAVDEHYIYCDSQDQVMYEEDLGLKEHWKFDRDTGEEIDFDPAGSETGSRLICPPA